MSVFNERDPGDDWVLDSLDRYERLHVFELQDPTLCMEWSHDNTAFYVAGFSTEKHNELLQLLLPEKLLPADKQTLLARRDFKIGRGALCKKPIHHIQCPDHAENVVITSGMGSEVTMWGPDSASPDLLVATGSIATPTPNMMDSDRTELHISCSPSHPHSLLTGSSINTLQTLDLHTLKQTWQHIGDSDDSSLHGLVFLPKDTTTFVTNTGRGELIVWDSRQAAGDVMKFSMTPLSNTHPPAVTDEGLLYAMAVCGEGRLCACLSEVGDLQLFDVRGASHQSVVTCQLPVRVQSSHFMARKIASKPCVQFSGSSGEMSVSGVGRGVTVYDITEWSGAVHDPLPVFMHNGHEADNPQCKVTVHSWHPSFHSMILSCDSGGIMHAWQWKK